MNQLKSAYYDLLYMEIHIYKKLSIFNKGTLSAWNVAHSDLSYMAFKIEKLSPHESNDSRAQVLLACFEDEMMYLIKTYYIMNV